MTQEEFNDKVVQEIKNIKCAIEINLYLTEKNRIINELNMIKSKLQSLSNNKDTNVFKYQLNRDKLLEMNSIIEKYNKENQQLTPEEQTELNNAINEKNQLETWFKKEIETKNSKNNELLQTLNIQEIRKKELLHINDLIKRYYTMNPPLQEKMNVDDIIVQINNIESIYDTDDFNEDEYNKLKDEFIEIQNIVSTMISTTEEILNQSKSLYEEKKQEIEKLKNDNNKTELYNALINIKNYEIDYTIWNETLNEINQLKREHNFLEKKEEPIVIEEVEEAPEIEKTPTIEEIPITEEVIVEETPEVEDNNIPEKEEQIITDYFDIDAYKKINNAYKAGFSKRFLNNLIMNTEFIMNGDILLEGNIDIKNDDYPMKRVIIDDVEEEISHNNNKIDILNNIDARDKISHTNNTIKKILNEINNNSITQEEGIDKINELINTNNELINKIITKYENIKDALATILSNSKKCDDITKISLGKVKELNELKELNLEELNLITILNQKDYEELIILLINQKQYEKTIEEINSIELDNNIKTK